VCCRGSVFDATAQCFTRAFYRAFAAGKSVQQAFDLARLEIRTAPQPGLRAEAEKYLLLPEGSHLHQSCFCDLSWGSGGRCRSEVACCQRMWRTSAAAPGTCGSCCNTWAPRGAVRWSTGPRRRW
ncbi:unnamed protein product, partial [Effrenium voratum]